MLRLPSAFNQFPERLNPCASVATPSEIATANAVRAEYVLPGQQLPYMEDIVRAFRIAEGAKIYLEVGTQDKGNLAWLARTKLAKGATIIDIDLLDYPENDRKIKGELSREFDYHSIRADCLNDGTLAKIKDILSGRLADVIFCDSHYTYEHTLIEFGLYYPLVREGGFLLFHDAQWPGESTSPHEEERKKGKGLAIEQLDRFYPAWMIVGPQMPPHRPLPPVDRKGHWGTVAIFAP